jgi:hypothetical protein
VRRVERERERERERQSWIMDGDGVVKRMSCEKYDETLFLYFNVVKNLHKTIKYII